MGDWILQVGAGGLFVLGCLKLILDFLEKKRTSDLGLEGKKAGDLPPEYWQAKQRESITEVLKTLVLPLFQNQTEILGELRKVAQEQANATIKIQFTMDEIRKIVDRTMK